MKLTKMTLKEMDEEMEEIVSRFFKAKYQKNNSFTLMDVENENEENDHVLKVEKAFYSLNSLEQLFMNNDYFLEAYPYWWVGQYSKTTYYRERKKAVEHFLRLFYGK